MAQLKHQGFGQIRIAPQELRQLWEKFLVRQRVARKIAEEPHLQLVPAHPAHKLDAPEQQEIVDGRDQALGGGYLQVLLRQNDRAIFVADAAEDFVVANLALGQANHRLQIQIHPIFFQSDPDDVQNFRWAEILRRNLWGDVLGHCVRAAGGAFVRQFF